MNPPHPSQRPECIDLALSLGREIFDERLSAIFTIGSLAHGGFAPMVSDVDLAFLIDDIVHDDKQKIVVINAAIKNSKLPLSDRVSIFWSSWDQLKKGEILIGRFPSTDRLDFIDDRKLIWGSDQSMDFKIPTKKELILEGAKFALEKLLVSPHSDLIVDTQKLIQSGQRQVTKTVLFPVRFIYTGATGNIGTNEAAVSYWIQHCPDDSVKELVKAAFRWRTNYNEAEAANLLPKNLSSIYGEFIRKYAGYCREYGEVELAEKMADPNRGV